MHKTIRPILSVLAVTVLTACSATQTADVASPEVNQTAAMQPSTVAVTQDNKSMGQGLTLEQIMADPDWIGRSPESPFWSADAKHIFFEQKRQGSVIRDLWKVDAKGDTPASKVSMERVHQFASDDRVYNADKSQWAWRFEGNIFVGFKGQDNVLQLTRDNQRPRNLMFLQDGRLSYRVDNAIYAIDTATGRTQMLVHWKFSEAPEAVEPPKDYIAEQQLALISVLAKRRQDRTDRFDHQHAMQQANPSMTPKAIYLTPDHNLEAASLSPNGKYLILVESKDTPTRTDNDIMPNYINDDGRIASDRVRQRVADAKPENHQLWYVEVETGKTTKLSFSDLPGYNEDVLAEVKRENAQAKGETYQNNRLPRDITLMRDWYWSQQPIVWHQNGEQVAIMLEAWDNKDRWIATLNSSKNKLVSQHRLHDDAWINYKFNGFGWLNNSETLYFLSEQSGYSHLYTKTLSGKPVQVTSGTYEVDNLTLSSDDQYMYFQANKKHPGIYEVYRVNLANKAIETLTDLNGMIEYSLSDDESQLLLTHSKLTQPPELFVATVGQIDSVKQLTDTTTDAFKQINWQAPDIVPVASSYADKPVYSRVYYPQDYQQGEKRRAVIFNHGAGYLQNAHLGWSGYFREFMFHNMLVQKGYVVMDMDYRASMGYGRDWRTAIYRHMGKPEIEDLRDGVNWLVDNANVDRKRIGTYGGSYGGFMTFMALFTEPDLFQAGAALRPVSDWAHYNHGYTSNILNTPDVDPIAYERSSPIYFAEGLQEPLLINAPMVDSNVFFVDVVRLVQRMIELEKEDFETAIYPVESHGFVEPSSWLDEYRRIFKLFEQEL